jgi:hypothetical protein
LLPAAFDGCFASLPLRVFRPESRDEILFRGEGCDSSCTGKLGTLFSVKYVLVACMCLCEAFKNLNAHKKGIFIIMEKTRVFFVKYIWTGGNFKIRVFM